MFSGFAYPKIHFKPLRFLDVSFGYKLYQEAFQI